MAARTAEGEVHEEWSSGRGSDDLGDSESEDDLMEAVDVPVMAVRRLMESLNSHPTGLYALPDLLECLWAVHRILVSNPPQPRWGRRAGCAQQHCAATRGAGGGVLRVCGAFHASTLAPGFKHARRLGPRLPCIALPPRVMRVLALVVELQDKRGKGRRRVRNLTTLPLVVRRPLPLLSLPPPWTDTTAPTGP